MTKRAMSLFVGVGLLVGAWSWADAQWLLITTRDRIQSLTGSGDTLYAGTSGNETGGYVIASVDGGAYWMTLNSAGWPSRTKRGLPPVFIVSCVEAGGSFIYAGANNGLYISKDGGSSWIPPAGIMAGQTIYCVAAAADRIFAGGQKGVLVSEDGGASWTTSASGLDQSHYIKSLAIAGTAVFAGTSSGILVSRDNGRSWAAANTGLPDKADIACLATIGTRIFAGLAGGTFRSDDGGARWVPAGGGLPPGAGASCFAVNGRTIYAGFSDLGVFASTDEGQAWRAINAGWAPEHLAVRQIAANDRQVTAYVYNSKIINFEFWRWPLSGEGKAAPEAAGAYFQNGQKAYRENDFKSAVLHYTKAIEIDPAAVDAYLQRAWSYLKIGEAGYDKGLADLAKVQSLDPANTTIHFPRGEIYRIKADLARKAGNTKTFDDFLAKALANYDLALKANPGSPAIPLGLALALIARGDLDQALTVYAGLYDKKPHDTEIEGALKSLFAEYVRQDRDIDCGTSRSTWYLAGNFYAGRNDNSQAVRCYSRAVDLGLADGIVFFMRSAAYSRMGDFDRAIADATKDIELSPHEGSFKNRAEIYAKRGDYEKAIADMTQAIRLQKKVLKGSPWDYNFEEFAKLYLRRGDLYFLKKDWNKAIDDYKFIDENLKPGLLKQAVNLQIAEAYKNKGDVKNAQKYMDLYRTVGPPKK